MAPPRTTTPQMNAGGWVAAGVILLAGCWLAILLALGGRTRTRPLAWEHLEPPAETTLRAWQSIELFPTERPGARPGYTWPSMMVVYS